MEPQHTESVVEVTRYRILIFFLLLDLDISNEMKKLEKLGSSVFENKEVSAFLYYMLILITLSLKQETNCNIFEQSLPF